MPPITTASADRLARQVLRQRLGVRPKETVTIEAYSSSLPWAVGFVREARRIGAHPLLHFEDEAAYWTAVDEGHAAVLGSPGRNEWGALKETDVYVYFWGPEDMGRRSKISEKVGEQLTAFNPEWYRIAGGAGLRGARMGIARATAANARLFGVDLASWRRAIFNASVRDPSALRKDAEIVRRRLERGREVRIRHPNGTDLRLGLKGRPAQLSIGEMPPQRSRKSGGPMTSVPDATVYVAVDESVADGSFRANRETTTVFSSVQRDGRFDFTDGSLKRYRFGSGGSEFARDYRAAARGRERPSFLEVGLDPMIRGKVPLLEETERGAVTVGVGRNAGFGGATTTDFLGYLTLADAEVSVDGRPLLRGGTLLR